MKYIFTNIILSILLTIVVESSEYYVSTDGTSDYKPYKKLLIKQKLETQYILRQAHTMNVFFLVNQVQV